MTISYLHHLPQPQSDTFKLLTIDICKWLFLPYSSMFFLILKIFLIQQNIRAHQPFNNKHSDPRDRMNVTCHSIALACWRKWRNGGPAPSTLHQAHSAKYATQRCLPARKAQSTKVKKKTGTLFTKYRGLHQAHQSKRQSVQ